LASNKQFQRTRQSPIFFGKLLRQATEAQTLDRTISPVIGNLDQIIERSLRKLAEDTHVLGWCAKEHDWVNYFAHRYLLLECSPRGPLKEPAQICIEVAVPQPPGYPKQSVCRDLVIWPMCGDTCFDVKWRAFKHPLAILEWTVHRPRHRKPKRKVDGERAWLKAYGVWQPSVLTYAIEIDGRCSPTRLVCTRFLGLTENKQWLDLMLEGGPNKRSQQSRR
jgi:hypothetical protein